MKKSLSPVALVCLLISTFTAPLVAAEKTDPSGTWKRSYDWDGAPVEEVLRVNLKADGGISGTLARNESVKKIKKGAFKDGKLSVSVSDEYQGANYTVTYTGAIKGDEIVDGTVTAEGDGESYEWPWATTRAVELADVVGRWQFTIETGDGNVLEPTLEISKDGNKFKPVYTSMQGMVVPVEKLRVEKNNLMFTINAEYDGGTLKVDYKGRPYGDKYNGTLDYDMNGETGELDFTAKRSSSK